ncbi:4'-phosphopantetheinyl transferase HetI-like isoform X2 [Panicum virgatum]|uniref:4'-phosphopantetheinyl transferase HetI-like isoform X2 n=1 Tax=Panicum virgatum TaxID=38727 RepID=UPI0019D69A66|nr:4'-phosphopantetheinyl transferase HetI-like isoform X2 [Panicum virgatum]
MRHRLLRRAMPLPPPTPPAPRTPGIAGGRLFSSLPPPPPPLQSRREVHVWYLLPDELNDASQLKMYMDLLSPSERKNALSMNTEKLQKGAVLSRALVRTTLSRYCKVDPGSFEFKKNKFGKPEILWQSDDNKMEWPLHFNISHTSSLIACGITMDNLIGIDIEEKKRKTAKNILSLARRYFTPSEVDYLAQIPDPDAQQKEFIKLWTLKEAYVKALGRGFSGAPFNKFSIEMEAKNGIRISVAPKVFKDSDSTCDCLSENWQFALAELNSSHYMAVCVGDDSRSSESGNGRLPLGLKVWKTVPFLEDTLVSGTEALTRIV